MTWICTYCDHTEEAKEGHAKPEICSLCGNPLFGYLHSELCLWKEQVFSGTDAIKVSVDSAGTEAGGSTTTERVEGTGSVGRTADNSDDKSVEYPASELAMILANSTFLLSRALAHCGELDLKCARELAIAISNHIADIHAYAYTKDISFEFVQAQFDLIKKWN